MSKAEAYKMMRGTPLNTQMQKAVISAYQFFEKEKNNGCTISVSRPIDRTASALGLSRSTVCHYLGKWRRGEELITPGKRRPRSKPKREVDDITKTAIRNIIYELHMKGVNITVTTLLAELRKSEVSFTGARETLRRVLHDLGFKFSKTDGRKYILQEVTNEPSTKKSKKSANATQSQARPLQSRPPQPPLPPQQPMQMPQPQQMPQISQPQHVPVSQPQHVPVSQPQHVPVSQPQHVPVSQPQHVSVSQSQHVPVSQAPPVTHPQHLPPVSHVPQTHLSHQPTHLQVPQVSHVQHQHIQQTSHMQQSHVHMSHLQQMQHPVDTRPRQCLPRDDVVSALNSIAGLMHRSDGSYVDASRH